MVSDNGIAAAEPKYDRLSELKAFDDTKTGVKGLVDAGITKVPRIFIQPPTLSPEPISGCTNDKFFFPTIDLVGIDRDPVRYKETVEKVRDAAGKWGFFQVINHGIPASAMQEMKDGVRRFFEQDDEIKKEWYTRDYAKATVYNSNFDLYKSPAANWRDTIYFTLSPNTPNPADLPETCRDILIDYSNRVRKLGNLLFELLSEALGLNRDYLKNMECAEGLAMICHYYPPCPQPELTIGTRKHSDNDFLTVLMQDQIGGLQVRHQNQWVDVPPLAGALVVNIGDLLQLMSNDKCVSVEHRVVANRGGPRVSVAGFFSTGVCQTSKLYEPIKELLSEDHPPKYRPTSVKEFVEYFRTRGVDNEASILSHFEL